MNFFIHIGTHKTGSTAIQHFFLINRPQLIEQGFLYPETGLKNAGHHEIAWASRHENDLNRLEKLIKQIKREAEEANCENIILSSEEFEFIHDLRYLKSAMSGNNCQIIIFLRRQDTLLESEYNQHVKMPSTKYNDSIFKFHFDHDFHHRFNYKYLCNLWGQKFGQDTLSIVSYDHCSKQPLGIFKAIFNLINIPFDDGLALPKSHRYNVSLPNKATIYLARLNTLSLPPPQHQLAISLLNELFSKKMDRPLLSLNDRKTLWMRYKHSNESLENTFNTQCFDEPSEAEHNDDYIDFHHDFDPTLYTALIYKLLSPKWG